MVSSPPLPLWMMLCFLYTATDLLPYLSSDFSFFLFRGGEQGTRVWDLILTSCCGPRADVTQVQIR